jgi:hypothetical protein
MRLFISGDIGCLWDAAPKNRDGILRLIRF